MEPRILGAAVSPGKLFYEKCKRQASTSTDGTSVVALAPANPSTLLQTIRSAFPSEESSTTNGDSSKTNPPRRYLGTVPSSGKNAHAYEARPPNIDEELLWFDYTLVWSRGTTIHRTFTYAHEGQRIKHAMFAWFRETPVPAGSMTENDQQATAEHDVSYSSCARSKKPAKRPPANTFGPWAASYNASWSARTRTNITGNGEHGSENNPLQRCLVVFLENIARVYFPSGEDKILPIPFELDTAWPLPGGGLILQRAATRKETEVLKQGKAGTFAPMTDHNVSNMDRTMDLMLEELDNNAVGMDLGLQPVSNQARIYTVAHPTSEMMFLCHATTLTGGFVDIKGKHRRAARPSQLRPIAPGMEIIFVSDSPDIPLYACYDHSNNELVFYRWARLSDQQEVSPTLVDIAKPPTEDARSTDMQGILEANGKPSSRQKRVSIAPDAITYSRRPRTSNAEAAADAPRRRPSLKRERSNTVTANTVDPLAPQSGVEIVRAALNENGNLLDSRETIARTRAEGDVIRGVSRKVERRWSTQPGTRPSSHAKVLHDVTEADLRETTMLMGLEKVERSVLSDVVGEQIHRWKLPTKLVDLSRVKIFLSDILSPKSAHVNIHIQDPDYLLYVFHLRKEKSPIPHFHMVEVACHPASFASPVICTRPNIHDVIIQDSTLTHLSVVTSGDQTYNLTQRLATDSSRSLIGARVLDVADSRLTLLLPTGSQLRLDVDFNVQHSLTQQCLVALASVLRARDFFLVKIATLSHYSRKQQHQWTMRDFECVLFSVLGLLDTAESPKRCMMDDPWESMLQDITAKRELHLDTALPSKRTSQESLKEGWNTACEERISSDLAPFVIQALHVVAEDRRLVANRQTDVLSLAEVVVNLAAACHFDAWTDYWMRIAPSVQVPVATCPSGPPIGLPGHLAEPFDFTCFLGRMLRENRPKATKNAILLPKSGIAASKEYGGVEAHPVISRLLSVFAKLQEEPPEGQTKEEVALFTLVENGADRNWLSQIQWHISMPIWEAIRALRSHTKTSWPLKMYRFLDRLDIAAQLKMTRCQLPVEPWIQNKEIHLSGNYKQIMKKDRPHNDSRLESSSAPSPAAPALPNLRFAHDRRLQDVERLLQYTRPRIVKADEKPNMSDEDRHQYHQHLVDSVVNRNFSSIIGYGILTFDSVEPSITERFSVPPVSTTVFVAPSTTALEMKHPQHSVTWPLFHSGVAAGLSIRDPQGVVDSSWITFNKPERLNSEHAGFLLGLGLSGHLKCLTPWAAYPYLEARHEQTSLGLLLGMGASYAGSQDRLLTTVLSSHISALLPPGSIELNTSPIVQAGSWMSFGLVHVASGAFRFAEASLNEIQRRLIPGVEPFTGFREIYSFSAACAFGLIMLGQGNKNAEFELSATERLRRCLMESEDPQGEDKNDIEEDGIDLNVTAPGATLALGFMYMRTNRKDISDMIRPPDRPFLLDTIRPDLLLLRTVATCLIHFDEIESTYEWLNRQIPDYITGAWNKRVELNYIDDGIELAYLNIVAGASFALGLKYVGSMDQPAYQIVYHFFMYFINSSNTGNSYEAKIRRSALRQAVNMISIALALIVAAHGDVSTYRRLRQYHGSENNSFGSKTALHMATGLIFAGAGRYSFGKSNLAIASLCIAFFPRWPRHWDENKPYLQAYRHLWAVATEPHCLSTVDIDTLQTVYMPIGITALTGDGDETNTRIHISPTLVADIDQVVTLHLTSPRYMFQPLDISSNAAHRQILLDSHALFVRRRTPFLDYFDDPKGNRSLSILTEAINVLPTDQGSKLTGPAVLSSEMRQLDNIVGTYASVPWVKGCVDRLVRPNLPTPEIASGQVDLSQGIISSVIDCLVADREDLLPRYLDFLFNLDIYDRDFGIMQLQNITWVLKYLSTAQTSANAAFEYARHFDRDWMKGNAEQVAKYWTNPAAWAVSNPEQAFGLAFHILANDVPQRAKLLALKQQVNAVLTFRPERRRAATLPDYVLVREILREAIQSLTLRRDTAIPGGHESSKRAAPSLTGWTETSMLDALRAWLSSA